MSKGNEEIKIFENEEFGQIRMIEIDGKPYFVGKDIALSLGYRDTINALKQHCRGVVKHHLIDSKGRIQEVNFIGEGDMYRLIVHSKLESAIKFEHWVFDEVVPSIVHTGSYTMIEENPNEPDLTKDVPSDILWFSKLETANQLNILDYMRLRSSTGKVSKDYTSYGDRKPQSKMESPLPDVNISSEKPMDFKVQKFRYDAIQEAKKVCIKHGIKKKYKQGLSMIYKEMVNLGINWELLKKEYSNKGGTQNNPSTFEILTFLPEYQSVYFQAAKSLVS